MGVKLEIVGPDLLTERKARVVVMNHQSTLDMAWMSAIIPPAPLVIGKKELIYIPMINLAWWAVRFIRIDRGNHAKAIAALAGVGEMIVRERRSLVIAPEGTRSRSGEIQHFKKGAFHMARQAGVPRLPGCRQWRASTLPKGAYFRAKA